MLRKLLDILVGKRLVGKKKLQFFDISLAIFCTTISLTLAKPPNEVGISQRQGVEIQSDCKV